MKCNRLICYDDDNDEDGEEDDVKDEDHDEEDNVALQSKGFRVES